jgi:hypothetical protein
MNLPTSPPPTAPTLQNLCSELNKRGFSATIHKDFVVVKFTPAATKIGYTLHGLEMQFSRRLVKTCQDGKGFYLAFSA